MSLVGPSKPYLFTMVCYEHIFTVKVLVHSIWQATGTANYVLRFEPMHVRAKLSVTRVFIVK
jgi:hypothetical protein